MASSLTLLGSEENERIDLQMSSPASRSLLWSNEIGPTPGHTRDRYAKADALSQYIPGLDYKNPQTRSWTGKRTTLLILQTTLAVVTLSLAIGIIIWAIKAHPPNSRAVGTFFVGACSTTTTLNSALHVLLNSVGSLFLAAGTYCMQILVAPSPEDINRAHRKGVALDIGVPSVRNLRHIAKPRSITWLGFGIVATVMHVFLNSSLFSSVPVAAISNAIVTNDFWTAGGNWTTLDPLSHREMHWFPPVVDDFPMVYNLQSSAANMTQLNTTECVKRYTDPASVTSSLIVVARNVSSAQNGGSSLIQGWVSAWESWVSSAAWICRAYQRNPDSIMSCRTGDCPKFCSWEFAENFAGNWTLYWPIWLQVDHCLVGDEGVCTFVEVLLIGLTFFQHWSTRVKNVKGRERTMVTMGDVIDSFLDPLLSTDEILENHSCSARRTVVATVDTWQVKPSISWFKAVSIRAWTVSMFLFIGAIAGASYMVSQGINWVSRWGLEIGPKAIAQLGFRPYPAAIAYTLDILPKDTGSTGALLGNTMIVNSPQIGISFLYIFYNNNLTRQLVTDEWVRFLQKDGKKALRVSSPRGMQRSSYFLSLPLKYSVPLKIVCIVMHWLISQSIFVVYSTAFGPGPHGTRLPQYYDSGRGTSPLGGIIAVSFGLLLVIILFINSVFRRYNNVPPDFLRMGVNSTAIKTVCQAPRDDCDARFFPLRMGVVPLDEGDDDQLEPGRVRSVKLDGKIVFSTDTRIMEPVEGGVYLMPGFVPRKTAKTFNNRASHTVTNNTTDQPAYTFNAPPKHPNN
ncbi:hypothetical protein BDV19DRAFT_385894 [Aspergillus venezuelensis]